MRGGTDMVRTVENKFTANIIFCLFGSYYNMWGLPQLTLVAAAVSPGHGLALHDTT